MLRFALFCVLAGFLVGCCALPSASARPALETQRSNTTDTLPPEPAQNETYIGSGEQQLEEPEIERNTCPGCCEHVKAEGCRKPSNIDHVQALGFKQDTMTDWTSCTLPHFPQTK